MPERMERQRKHKASSKRLEKNVTQPSKKKKSMTDISFEMGTHPAQQKNKAAKKAAKKEVIY